MNENKDAGIIRAASADAEESSGNGLSRNLLPKVLCILAAFVLWLYVMQVESPEYEHEITSVAVNLENDNVLLDEAGLYVYAGRGNRVNVTVAGRKSIVTKLTADDIKAYVDMSRIKEAGRHSLEIAFDLPEDVTLVDGNLSTVTVYVDEADEVNLPVRIDPKNFVLEAPYELGEIECEFDTVKVTGPKNRLNNLAGAVVTIDMQDHKSTFDTIAEITLVDKLGNNSDMDYLNMSQKEMYVTVPIYITKEYPVSVNFKHGLVDEQFIKVTCEPSSLLIKADAGKLADGSLPFDEIVIDETELVSAPYIFYHNIELRDGLTNLSNVTEIKVTVEYDRSIVTRNVAVDEISVTGAHHELDYEIINEIVIAKLRGNSEELKKITAADVSVAVDLNGIDPSSSGTLTRYAIVSIVNEDIKSVFALGTYPIQIKINQNEE